MLRAAAHGLLPAGPNARNGPATAMPYLRRIVTGGAPSTDEGSPAVLCSRGGGREDAMRECVFCDRRTRANLYIGDRSLCPECIEELKVLLGLAQADATKGDNVTASNPAAPPTRDMPSGVMPAASAVQAPAQPVSLPGLASAASGRAPSPPAGAVPVPAGMLSGVSRPAAAPVPGAVSRPAAPTPGAVPRPTASAPAGLPRPSAPGLPRPSAPAPGLPRPSAPAPGAGPRPSPAAPAGVPRPTASAPAGLPRPAAAAPAPGAGLRPSPLPAPSTAAVPGTAPRPRKPGEPDLTALLGKKS